MKNKNLFESIKHALNGIKLAFKSEKNLKKYIVIAIIFGVLNILTKSTYIDAIFYIILCFIVFAFIKLRKIDISITFCIYFR